MTTHRKRGAPRGNTNAVTHGLYARSLHLRTLKRLIDSNIVDLSLERQLIDLFFTRIHAQAPFVRTDDPRETANRVLVIALFTFVHLLHQKGILNGTVNAALEQAFAEVLLQLTSGSLTSPEYARGEGEFI